MLGRCCSRIQQMGLIVRSLSVSSLAFASLLGLASTANATVLYNNLSAASFGADSAGSFGPLADSFSTGGSSFDLSRVTVLVDGTADGGSFEISLLSDNSTSPGSVIATTGPILDSTLPGALTAETFDLSAVLSPDTRYWIEISSAAGVTTSLGWSWSLDTSGTGVSTEFFSNASGVFSNIPGDPYQMLISDAVPEAPTWAMLVLGFGALGAAMRLRMRARTA